jgi:hypothetical protein
VPPSLSKARLSVPSPRRRVRPAAAAVVRAISIDCGSGSSALQSKYWTQTLEPSPDEGFVPELGAVVNAIANSARVPATFGRSLWI